MFADAVENAIESLTDIVALRRGLTQEQCVGLFGELVVLIALADETVPPLRSLRMARASRRRA